MIPVQLEHINQDILKNRIESLEAGYIDSLITLIQWPKFIESICKDLLEKWITDERRKGLEQALDANNKAIKGHTDSMEQLNKTLTEVKTYLSGSDFEKMAKEWKKRI